MTVEQNIEAIKTHFVEDLKNGKLFTLTEIGVILKTKDFISLGKALSLLGFQRISTQRPCDEYPKKFYKIKIIESWLL
jgi:hypothetical protein